jgi:hypothetical protein
LQQIYPQHQIRIVLIWTETGAVMDVPEALLEAAAPA